MKILNAFSLNMLANLTTNIKTEEISLEEAKKLLSGEINSAVGHLDTAKVFSSVLGVEVPMNRTTVQLHSGETILVGQYIGPRLPEGATELPQGSTIKWVIVEIK